MKKTSLEVKEVAGLDDILTPVRVEKKTGRNVAIAALILLVLATSAFKTSPGITSAFTLTPSTSTALILLGLVFVALIALRKMR